MQLTFLLQSTRNNLIYHENQNQYLLDKTKSFINESKNDFTKLLEIVKEKEREINLLDEDLKRKKDNIFVLQDKLLSINVLEKKITTLDEKYIKDAEKSKLEYENNLKKHFNFVQNDPIFTHKIKENEDIRYLNLCMPR